ncbi:hypothetical protein OK351_14815 [Glutamicibacter sp. MNS18]|uniref:hypothetical protein n=1 Tax=Glutamicibacter sp. MNS18 TaxID=2989817 RepID=UPI0022369B9B|nr:hypothetical protein [Glutamicibacter sp. MNS18]MCW4466763.1 hypothetical protein [Glutamicibacter sp. MNS18]
MALRRALGMLCILLLCLGTSACGTGEALRIESPATRIAPGTPPAGQTSSDGHSWEEPFAPSQVREILLETDLGAVSTPDNSAEDIREYLIDCDKCLIALPGYETADEKFQIYSISTAADSYSFASFVIRNARGKPEVALAVGGSDVYLSAGKEGSVVAQEALYKRDDPMCCPSGWSVRMFRYQDGQFVQGDSFSSPIDPLQEEGASP